MASTSTPANPSPSETSSISNPQSGFPYPLGAEDCKINKKNYHHSDMEEPLTEGYAVELRIRRGILLIECFGTIGGRWRGGEERLTDLKKRTSK
ncbi:hypothetical protein CDAR_501631 [Caerostris darwini]|uniref:Uncharacterized protein n=1 Tax=Caerostris darwini TaxID=1538125 RepID=A0AAV4PW68_9ARAC|nr:hypothetical protein CDAR_501631 [Caerostris darwini]